MMMITHAAMPRLPVIFFKLSPTNIHNKKRNKKESKIVRVGWTTNTFNLSAQQPSCRRLMKYESLLQSNTTCTHSID